MERIETQLAVIGGGPAGICAALQAARLGIHTVLVHNRPVLGGNSSSEVRVWTRGAVGAGNLFAEEMGIWGELKLRNLYTNPEFNPVFWDEVLLDAVLAQPNLQLLLNTHVTRVSRSDGKIQVVFGSQQGSEKDWEIQANWFIDATGDGTLAAQVGVPYQVGDVQYDPENPPLNTEVLGSSILYYVKKLDHPVRFVAPEYAYSLDTVEKLVGKGGRILTMEQTGSDCWWFEYGGLRNTIADAQDIALELKRMVMGVWNYIKNSGRYQAECYTLEWVGSLPGKRESRRMQAEYMLTGQDVQSAVRFEDGAFYGGWYMDFHPAAGMDSEEEFCTQIPVQVYSVPLRCLYHREHPNLLFAGRIIGTERDAFVSTRVMNTCALSGQAAAALVWGCTAFDTVPARLTGSQIQTVRQLLLREDMFIPGLAQDDPKDLARTAQITASSTFVPDVQEAGGLPLTEESLVVLPCPESGEVQLKITARTPSTLRGRLYAAALPSRLCPGQLLGEMEWSLRSEKQLITVRLPEKCQGRFATLVLEPCAGAELLLADRSIPGVLCGRTDQPDYHTPWIKADFKRMYNSQNVVDGFHRIWERPHLWCSEAEEKPWICLNWEQPVELDRVELYLDPELSMEIPSSHAGRWEEHHKFAPRTGMPPQLMRTFRLEAWQEGEWRTVARCSENWRRNVVLLLEHPIITNRMRLVCEANWGNPRAHLFQIRVYKGDWALEALENNGRKETQKRLD